MEGFWWHARTPCIPGDPMTVESRLLHWTSDAIGRTSYLFLICVGPKQNIITAEPAESCVAVFLKRIYHHTGAVCSNNGHVGSQQAGRLWKKSCEVALFYGLKPAFGSRGRKRLFGHCQAVCGLATPFVFTLPLNAVTVRPRPPSEPGSLLGSDHNLSSKPFLLRVFTHAFSCD